MVSWRLVFTSHAQRDAKKIAGAGLRSRVESLLEIFKRDPFQSPPRYERLLSELKGAYSRRINIQHRFVYQVLESERLVKILRLWTHYE